MGSLTDNRSVVIKKADKWSCIVVWDRNDYLREAEKQFDYQNVYRKIAFKDNMYSDMGDSRSRNWNERA